MTLTDNGTTSTATGITGRRLVEHVREMVVTAHAEGRQPPGRPTIMAATGATDHQAKTALAQVRAELADRGRTSTTAVGGAATSTASAGPGETADDGPAASSSAAESTPVEPGGGRAVAWIGLVFGALASLAANWLHTWLPAAHQPHGWTPGIAPQIGAMVWPLALLLAVEVVSRVRWPRGWAWWLARFGGAGLVAAGSALISYGHLHDVLASWHYTPIESAVGPLVLDGLMTVCGVALLADGTHQQQDRPRRQPRRSERPARLPRPPHRPAKRGRSRTRWRWRVRRYHSATSNPG